MPPNDIAFVFLDLETTGLDPSFDEILEIGIVAVNSELDTLATFGITANWKKIEYDQKTGEYIPPFGVHKIVTEMHTKNGLWEDSYRSAEPISLCFLRAAGWLAQYLPTDGRKVPLAGNTIGFDRAFIHYWYPQFLELFHHRSIDVSSLRVLYEEWLPEGPPMPVGNDLHRSVPDCLDSLEKLRFFKKNLFRV